MATPLYMIATATMAPGEILTLGRHHGAYTSQYRVESIIAGQATLVPVKAESVRNPDGTFSTVHRDTCPAPAGTGQCCGAANACWLFRGHAGKHEDWRGDNW